MIWFGWGKEGSCCCCCPCCCCYCCLCWWCCGRAGIYCRGSADARDDAGYSGCCGTMFKRYWSDVDWIIASLSWETEAWAATTAAAASAATLAMATGLLRGGGGSSSSSGQEILAAEGRTHSFLAAIAEAGISDAKRLAIISLTPVPGTDIHWTIFIEIEHRFYSSRLAMGPEMPHSLDETSSSSSATAAAVNGTVHIRSINNGRRQWLIPYTTWTNTTYFSRYSFSHATKPTRTKHHR